MKQQVRIIHKQQLTIIIHLFLGMRIQGENFQLLYIFVVINPIKKMYEIIKKTLKLGLEAIIKTKMHTVNILMRNTVSAKQK